MLINFLESLKNIPSLPPRVLAIVSASIVGLGSLLHTFGGTKTSSLTVSGKGTIADDDLRHLLSGGEGSAVVASPASEAVTKVDRAEDVRSPAAHKPAAGDEAITVGKKPEGL